MAEDVYDVDADFDWDDANVRHMARHLGKPRFLTVLYTLRNNRTLVVTAYDMTKQPQHQTLAGRRGLSYQTYLKMLLHQALEKERRTA